MKRLDNSLQLFLNAVIRFLAPYSEKVWDKLSSRIYNSKFTMTYISAAIYFYVGIVITVRCMGFTKDGNMSKWKKKKTFHVSSLVNNGVLYFLWTAELHS